MAVEFFEDPLAIRKHFSRDLQRPQFHFLPPNNWMNDPNGLFFWHGEYHLFYQFNPFDAHWGSIHWGHASSKDLIHWEDHLIALAPEDGAGDDLGCFSGCLVADGETPTAIYTGLRGMRDAPVLLAQAGDKKLEKWTKSPKNPVIARPPEGVDQKMFRDPYVCRWGDKWQAVLGAGMVDGSSAALLYESDDLLTWDYRGPLFQDQYPETIKMWECPNFFSIDDQFVLLVSLYPDFQGVYYYTGDYDGQKFTPMAEGYLEKNKVFYAPQARQLGNERMILFGWLMEGRTDAAMERAGWAGVQSFPRELMLDSSGHLISRPIVELARLRLNEISHTDIQLPSDQRHLDLFTGRQYELDMTISSQGGRIEVELLASPDRSEVVRVGCDFSEGKVWLDTTQGSLSEDARGELQEVFLPTGSNEEVRFHILVDQSVVEVWVNDLCSMTGRAYPTQKNAQHVSIYSQRQTAKIDYFAAWELNSIWPDGIVQ